MTALAFSHNPDDLVDRVFVVGTFAPVMAAAPTSMTFVKHDVMDVAGDVPQLRRAATRPSRRAPT